MIRYLLIASLLLSGTLALSGESQNDKTAWFAGKWGVMFHYLATPAGTTGEGVATDAWRRQIDAFDVDALAEQLEAVGANYFVITLGQGSGHFLAPNPIYDQLLGPDLEKGPERDLVAELADALKPKGIRLILYTAADLGWGDLETRKALGMTSWHGDHRIGLREPGTPNDWQANRAGQIDFLRNWTRLHAYWSKKWGDKIAGWWVDGGYQKDIRFPEDEPPNFATMKAALLTGNPQAIVTFNGGKGVRFYSKHDDYTAGEVSKISRDFPKNPTTWYEEDGHRIRFHVLTYLGEKWGQGQPRFTTAEATDLARRVSTKGGFVTFDVPPLENGLIPEAFLPQLEQIGTAIRSEDSSTK